MKCFVVFFLVLSASLLSCTHDRVTTVSVDVSNVVSEEFIGHGVQWSAYPHADSEKAEWGALMTDEKWQRVYERLDYMTPHIIRVIDQANWRYLEGFDVNGKAVINYDSEEVRSLFKILDYCQRKNIIVLLGEWGVPYQVHDVNSEFHGFISDARDQRWLEMVSNWLDFLINEKKYTCIKYFNLVNEPNGSWASTDGDWDEWSGAVIALNEYLDKTGLLEQISIMGPDAVPWQCNSVYSGEQWLYKSVNELDDFIKCYDLHNYPHPDDIRNGEFGEYYTALVKAVDRVGKPLILGELGSFKDTPENQALIEQDSCASTDSQMAVYDFQYGIDMADAVIQAMNVGIDAVIAWDLDDAMHTKGDLGQKTQLKRWGFWNSLGTELCNNSEDEMIRPWYYPWSLLCRNFIPGMKVLKIEKSLGNNIRYSVANTDDKLTLAFVNNSIEAATIEIKVKGVIGNSLYSSYEYKENDYITDKNGFPVKNSVLELNFKTGYFLTLAPKSFVLITNVE